MIYLSDLIVIGEMIRRHADNDKTLPRVAMVAQCGALWASADNRTGDCWVETHSTLVEAYDCLQNGGEA